jgi:hypothetical protein
MDDWQQGWASVRKLKKTSELPLRSGNVAAGLLGKR